MSNPQLVHFIVKAESCATEQSCKVLDVVIARKLVRVCPEFKILVDSNEAIKVEECCD